MLLTNVIQLLAKNFSANEKIRPWLASVFFTKNKAVATDSYKLCEIELIEPKDPQIQNFKIIDQETLINKNDILNIKLQKDETLFIWENQKWLCFTNYNWFNQFNIKKHNWTFPTDYECFFNNSKDLEIWFDVNYLIDVLNIYKKAKVWIVNITFWDKNSPAIFEVKDKEDLNTLEKQNIKQIKSILMPTKI